jgi:hypothetical protein
MVQYLKGTCVKKNFLTFIATHFVLVLLANPAFLLSCVSTWLSARCTQKSILYVLLSTPSFRDMLKVLLTAADQTLKETDEELDSSLPLIPFF